MLALPIIIPEGFKALLSVGDKVSIGQALAERVRNSEEEINIADEFGTSVAAARMMLLKNPGDSVKNGELIALRSRLFGWKKEAIMSKVDGIVARYERDSGKLVIQTSYQSLTENILSPVDGKVALCDNEKIVIHTDKNIASGLAGSGTSAVGEIFVLEASLQSAVNGDALSYVLGPEAIGKIIVGGAFPREVLMKGIGIGGAAVIGVEIAEEDIDHLSQKGITTPVLAVDRDILKKLVSRKGKKAVVDAPSKSIIFLY